MGSLKRKIMRDRRHKADKERRASGNFARASDPSREILERGIFCDCYGTLFSYAFEKDELLVRYLNAKRRAGVNVTLVSSDTSKVWSKIQDIGLHPDIVSSLRDKANYYRRKLEILIDDDPTNAAKTIYHPQDKKFRMQMQNFFRDERPCPAACVIVRQIIPL